MTAQFNSTTNKTRGFVTPTSLIVVTLCLSALVGLFFLGRYIWPELSGWWLALLAYGALSLLVFIAISFMEFGEKGHEKQKTGHPEVKKE